MNLFFTRPLFLLLLGGLIPLVYYWRIMPTSLTPRRKRDALILRVLSTLCLILALAGAQIVSKSDKLTVLFLLDRSLSTGGDSEGFQRSFISEALEKKRREDLYGVVLFGGDAGVELPAGNHSAQEMGQLTTVVDKDSSELTSALRFSATSFPGETARRLVVLTDGQTTEPGVEEQVRSLSQAGIEVWMVPLPNKRVKDVLLSRFESPSEIATGEPFILKTVIESTGIEECQLLITENGVPKQNINLKLREGPNLFLIPQRRNKKGPVRYEARVVATGDKRQQNNKAETLSLIGDEKTVVVLRAKDGPGALVPLLRGAGIKAKALRPHELPKAVGAWRDISCLIIEDVDSLGWNKRLQLITSLLVREGGMGLMMCGSNATFGVGAYQRTPIEPLLPVNLAIRRPKDQPLSALVQCIDKSGSMGGDPIRMAREAAIAAGQTISKRDFIGVLGFDSAARWVVPFGAKGDGKALQDGIATLRAGGGTDLYPALSRAIETLEKTEAPLKHIIVLSDGAVAARAYEKLYKRANVGRITISAVAFGQGADIKFLENLTRKGKGRLFKSTQTIEGSTLAQIFIRDTVLATGAGIQEKPTEARPTLSGKTSPILAGLKFQGAPKLAAHNMASSKGGTAKTLLHTPKKDPILATGRAGLGRTVAWLSDLGGDWSKEWNQTPGPAPGLSLLETVLIRSVRGASSSNTLPLGARGNRLTVRPSSRGDTALLDLELVTKRPLSGPVRIVTVTASGNSKEVMMQPAGPFEARGVLRVDNPGSGLVVAQDTEGNLLGRTNFTIPLAPEFTRLGTNNTALKRWSQVPDGKFDPPLESVFKNPQKPVPVRTPLGSDLARGVLLLLMLEIAVRRMPLPKGRKKNKKKAAQATEARSRFARLRATKEAHRAKHEGEEKKTRAKIERLTKKATTSVTKKPPVASKPKSKTSSPEKSAPETESAPESTLARLKKARKKKGRS